MFKRAFEAYGYFASNHAVKIIAVVIIINGALGVGLLNLKTETRVEESYYPLDSEARDDQDRLKSLFPDLSGSNFQTLQAPTLGVWARVIIRKNNGNLLNRTILEEIKNMHNTIMSITTVGVNGSDVSYSDICAKTLGSCAVDGSVFLSSEFLAAVDAGNVTFPNFTLSNGRSIDYQLSIGGKIDSNGTHLRGIEYLKIEYWFRTDISDEITSNWCDEFLDVMEMYNSKYYEVAYAHYKSLDEELAKNVAGDIGLFSITMTLMITYSCVAVMSARLDDQVGQRIWLGFGGIAAAGLAILAAFGLCSAIGVEFVSIVGVMPFLIVGIGIDDMFILLSGLSEAQGRDKTVAEKIGKAMSTSGVGITITSITDLIAFMAGAGSQFLSVRNFCIYTGIAVVFCYINNITLFCACMTIHERRVNQGRHFVTCMKIKTKRDLTESENRSKVYMFCCTGQSPTSRDEAESLLDKLPRWLLPKIVLKTPIKVVIITMFLGYLGAAIYGCINLKQGIELSELVHEDSYYYTYSTWNQNNFKRKTPVSFIIDSPYSYSQKNVQDNVEKLVRSAKAISYIDDSFSVNWLQDYKSSTYYQNSNESVFIGGLLQFLADARYSRYVNDLVINAATRTISASRIHLLSVDLQNSQEEGKFMLETRDIAKDASINCFPFHPAFLAFEQYVSILGQTLQSVGIAVGSVFVVMCLFIPSPLMILFSTISVTMIMVGLFGYLVYFDIALSAITMIHLIMSVGFSVDFTAHICHGYMTSEGKSRDDRVIGAIDDTGAPIFHGAVSSIIGIAVLFVAKSYIFRTFAIVMILVLVFGICHSVLLLPVILSWFGPKGTCFNCKSNENSNTICPVTINSEEKEQDLPTHESKIDECKVQSTNDVRKREPYTNATVFKEGQKGRNEKESDDNKIVYFNTVLEKVTTNAGDQEVVLYERSNSEPYSDERERESNRSQSDIRK